MNRPPAIRRTVPAPIFVPVFASPMLPQQGPPQPQSPPWRGYLADRIPLIFVYDMPG